MNIAYRFAYLKESLVLFNSLLVLSKVIKENASWIVRASFISRLPGPLACKREYIVVLESLLCSYTVIRISIRHIEPWVVLQHTGRELSPSKYNGYIVLDSYLLVSLFFDMISSLRLGVLKYMGSSILCGWLTRRGRSDSFCRFRRRKPFRFSSASVFEFRMPAGAGFA